MEEKPTYEEQVIEASQLAATIVKLPNPTKERIRYVIDGADLACQAREEEEEIKEEAG